MTFDANGGSGAPAVVVDDPGATVSVAETSPQRSGFGFDGWNTDAGGTGTAYASGDDYTLPTNDGDVDTLYAQWDPVGYTHVTGSTALDGNGALQDGSVVKLDITVSPDDRFILSNDYLMALMASFASSGSSEHVFIGVPSSTFDAASIGSSDFLSAFKVYRQNATDLMFEQHNNGSYGASLSRSATALTQDAVFELSNSGELIRLFEDDMNSTLTEDVASGTRHDVGDADTTPRSIYIAAVGKGLTLPATSEGAYKIAIPTPLPDTYNFAGNVDTLIADSSSEIGHIAVNGSGDVFSVTRAGDAWVSKHDSSAVEQWRIATPISGDAYLAPASDGGLYIAGLDSGDNTQVNVVKYDGDGVQAWSRNVTTSAGSVELMGLDVLSGSPDEAVVVVGKVAGGSGADLTLGSEIPGVTVPSGHAEYLAFFDASTGVPQLIDATYRGAGASTVRGFTSVDARPNGSGAWWVAVGGGANATSDSTVSCFRFTYDPSAIPPLVEDFSCVNTDYAQDVVLTSNGGVVAATYGGNSTTVAVVKFDNTGAYSWYAEIVTDTYSPFPANSRGLEVDTSDNVYVAARRVGNSTTITANAVETTVSTPDSSPNGLLLSFSGSNGGLNWTRTV
ncbi:MAG: InlB B-repeat-containing protein, partial [Acidimicrobiaceae bacterium]